MLRQQRAFLLKIKKKKLLSGSRCATPCTSKKLKAHRLDLLLKTSEIMCRISTLHFVSCRALSVVMATVWTAEVMGSSASSKGDVRLPHSFQGSYSKNKASYLM
jgi:hypothetical protein